MENYKINSTILQQEIFRILTINAGKSFSIRGMARKLKKSATAISKSIKKLEKSQLIIINKNKDINIFSIELNRNNKKVIELKRIENLKLIYESNIIERLSNDFPGSTIILFGSYSKGEDIAQYDPEIPASDIDIAIINSKEKELDLEKYEKFLEKKISLNFYSSFSNIHKHLKNNILNGILLSGNIEL